MPATTNINIFIFRSIRIIIIVNAILNIKINKNINIRVHINMDVNVFMNIKKHHSSISSACDCSEKNYAHHQNIGELAEVPVQVSTGQLLCHQFCKMHDLQNW